MKTICKAATMTKCYPLTGGWVSSRNHWNNRAAVIECKGGYTALQSYSTIVCVRCISESKEEVTLWAWFCSVCSCSVVSFGIG